MKKAMLYLLAIAVLGGYSSAQAASSLNEEVNCDKNYGTNPLNQIYEWSPEFKIFSLPRLWEYHGTVCAVKDRATGKILGVSYRDWEISSDLIPTESLATNLHMSPDRLDKLIRSSDPTMPTKSAIKELAAILGNYDRYHCYRVNDVEVCLQLHGKDITGLSYKQIAASKDWEKDGVYVPIQELVGFGLQPRTNLTGDDTTLTNLLDEYVGNYRLGHNGTPSNLIGLIQSIEDKKDWKKATSDKAQSALPKVAASLTQEFPNISRALEATGAKTN